MILYLGVIYACAALAWCILRIKPLNYLFEKSAEIELNGHRVVVITELTSTSLDRDIVDWLTLLKKIMIFLNFLKLL